MRFLFNYFKFNYLEAEIEFKIKMILENHKISVNN